MRAQVLEPFKHLFEDNFMYFIYYGGRGGGKSESIAQALIIMSATKPLRILCIRETQSSISDSVKSSLEGWIYRLGLQDYFKVTRDEITSLCGSKFMFKGMQNYNAGNIKSIFRVDITWIEEAEYFSRRSWDLLIPSVIRVKNPKVICSFNPAFADDVVYDTFIAKTPPPNSYIKKLNYYDNPFFKDTALELQRKFEEENSSEAEYRHKWLGEIISVNEDSLWNRNILDKMIEETEFIRDNYIRIIVACDPATTNKDYSNEYGVVVMGINKEGIIHLIDDASNNFNPNEFANQVYNLYSLYQCDEVVVEVNNGGDFIKATLLNTFPTMNVKEVRASKDKVTRAVPVANLAHMGKVKHIKGGFKKLERQMKLLTMKGFYGSKGESPDRLDAYVWGCYCLADLSDKDTESLIFKADSIKNYYENNNFKEYKNILYISKFLDYYGIILIDIETDKNYNKIIQVKKAYLSKEYGSQEIKEASSVMIRNNELSKSLVEECFRINQNVKVYKSQGVFDYKLEERVLKVRECLTLNTIYFGKDFEESVYMNEKRNQLKLQLNRYSLESKSEFLLLDLFCDIIIIEYELERIK